MMLQIGFEIWTMQNDILFDNIYIGHSVEDAQKLKAETWDIKHPIEVAEEEETKPKDEAVLRTGLRRPRRCHPAGRRANPAGRSSTR